jgi:triosephosphate isomerase
MKYIIANWKAHKSIIETEEWLNIFLNYYTVRQDITVIICPPFPLLYPLSKKIHSFQNIFLGAQNVSATEEGAFTGEVPAKVLQDLVDYCIVGHSERRKYYHETNEEITKKISQLKKYNIQPILCISKKEELNMDAHFIAYEPLQAIGSGKNAEAQEVEETKKSFNLNTDIIFIYGGSVNEKNAYTYFETGGVQGLLIGTASLDPIEFSSLIRNI